MKAGGILITSKKALKDMHFNKHLNHSILNHSTMYLSYTGTLDGKEANRYLDSLLMHADFVKGKNQLDHDAMRIKFNSIRNRAAVVFLGHFKRITSCYLMTRAVMPAGVQTERSLRARVSWGHTPG